MAFSATDDCFRATIAAADLVLASSPELGRSCAVEGGGARDGMLILGVDGQASRVHTGQYRGIGYHTQWIGVCFWVLGSLAVDARHTRRFGRGAGGFRAVLPAETRIVQGTKSKTSPLRWLYHLTVLLRDSLSKR